MIILNLAHLWNLGPFPEALDHVECAAFAKSASHLVVCITLALPLGLG